jgi:glycosyltransferase involved in cell wall biosynthesis
VVVPIFNEVENLLPLHGAITHALAATGRSHEIVFVDDGSTDGSAHRLLELRSMDARVRVIRFRRNFGQTAAMSAGFDHARGDVLVTLDGDLQNDPADIPRMLDELSSGDGGQGFDIVCGWRKDRHDSFLLRYLPSLIANKLIARSTGVRIHDTGCTLKVYRAWVVRSLFLYSDMHRFIPALAAGAGARVGELPVRHHPRRYGRSKYGIARASKVFFDLMAVKMIVQFSAHPIRWFGVMSLPLFIAATAFFVSGLVKFGTEEGVVGLERWDMGAMTIGVVAGIVAVNVFLLGLLSELAVNASRVFVKRAARIREARS